jgi:hypothetical protein
MDVIAIRFEGALYLFLERFVVERDLVVRHVCTPLCWCCCIPVNRSSLARARNLSASQTDQKEGLEKGSARRWHFSAANHLMSPWLRQAWIKAAKEILRRLIATHNKALA